MREVGIRGPRLRGVELIDVVFGPGEEVGRLALQIQQ